MKIITINTGHTDMNITTTRTPGPWRIVEGVKTGATYVVGEDGQAGRVEFTNKADVQFMVTACNAHDELVAALRLVLLNLPRSQHDYPETVAARAALAKVQS